MIRRVGRETRDLLLLSRVRTVYKHVTLGEIRSQLLGSSNASTPNVVCHVCLAHNAHTEPSKAVDQVSDPKVSPWVKRRTLV